MIVIWEGLWTNYMDFAKAELEDNLPVPNELTAMLDVADSPLIGLRMQKAAVRSCQRAMAALHLVTVAISADWFTQK